MAAAHPFLVAVSPEGHPHFPPGQMIGRRRSDCGVTGFVAGSLQASPSQVLRRKSGSAGFTGLGSETGAGAVGAGLLMFDSDGVELETWLAGELSSERNGFQYDSPAAENLGRCCARRSQPRKKQNSSKRWERGSAREMVNSEQRSAEGCWERWIHDVGQMLSMRKAEPRQGKGWRAA